MYQGGGLIFGMLTGLYIWVEYIQEVLMYRGHINGILRYFHLESKLFFLRQFNKNRHGGMFKVKILDSLSRLTGCNLSITENKIHGSTVFFYVKHVMVKFYVNMILSVL